MTQKSPSVLYPYSIASTAGGNKKVMTGEQIRITEVKLPEIIPV